MVMPSLHIIVLNVIILLLITESGTVYTFGEGASGQLGHGTHCLQISTPRKLDVKFKVSSIACGESHTSIISGQY